MIVAKRWIKYGLVALGVANLAVLDATAWGGSAGSEWQSLLWWSQETKENTLLWAGIIKYRGPGDLVPGATAYYGLRAYDAHYAAGHGKAVQLRRDSDGALLDIEVLASGDLDNAAAKAFCQNATCYVARWYDQTGNGRDVSQPDLAHQPELLFNLNTGLAAVQFDYQRQTYLTGDFPWVAQNQPWAGQTALLDVAPTDWYEPVFDYGVMGMGMSLHAEVHDGGDSQFSTSIYGTDDLSGITTTAPAALTFYSTGTQIGGYENGTNWLESFSGSNIAGTEFNIGGSPHQYGIWLSGALGEVILYGFSLNSQQAQALAGDERHYFRF